MRRLPRTHKKLQMKKEHEPDFFSLSVTSPLPPLPPSMDESSAQLHHANVAAAQAAAAAAQAATSNGQLMTAAYPISVQVPIGMAPPQHHHQNHHHHHHHAMNNMNHPMQSMHPNIMMMPPGF